MRKGGSESTNLCGLLEYLESEHQFSSELTCLPLQVLREVSRAACISKWLQTVRIPPISNLSHYLAYVSPALTFNLFGLVVTTLLVPCPGPE